MKKHLFLIHGRNFKPDCSDLEALWLEALRHGITRDFGEDGATILDNIEKTFIYYGDSSNDFLRGKGKDYDPEEDVLSRQSTLDELKGFAKSAFTKRTYIRRTGRFRGLKEFMADALAGPTNLFGVADNLISMVAPDMKHYWEEETDYGSTVRWRLTEPLAEAFRKKEDVLLISHSLGSLISYDVLWKFSHYGEYQDIRNHQLSKFITLGSPLGNETVKSRLKGGSINGARKYPKNIIQWHNFAAEDDYISHDPTVANDFKLMKSSSGKTRIQDKRIYNLAFRDGEPNQHHGSGYLLHPAVSKSVYDWLEA